MMLTPTFLMSMHEYGSTGTRTNASSYYGLSYFAESSGDGKGFTAGDSSISSVTGKHTDRSSTLRTVSWGTDTSQYSAAGVFIPLASNGLVFHKNFKIEITDSFNSRSLDPLNGKTMLVYELF